MSGNGALRWVAKKAGRAAVAYGSAAARTLSFNATGRTLSIRALTYHRFGDIARDPFCVSAAEFAQQMRAIARDGLAISLAQVEAFLQTGAQLPRDAVLVTIDDGFLSTLTVALPILEQYGIPAVAFVSPGKIAERRGTDGAPEDYLSWDELQFLARRGVSVQSHAWTHRSLPYLSKDAALEELICSREVLGRRVGNVTALAYPFGTRADFSDEVASLVEQAGYRLAFTSQHGAIRPGAHPLLLPRTKVERGESNGTFSSLLHGGLDAWRFVDHALWPLQASRRGQA